MDNKDDGAADLLLADSPALTEPTALSEEARERLLSAMQTSQVRIMRAELHQGPVPHPAVARGWENAHPGAADRLLRMAEQSVQAEITFRQKEQNFTWLARFVGQLTGGLLGVGAFLIALKAIDANMPVVAGTVVTVTLVTLAGLIITGRWQSARVEETSGNDTTSSPPSQ